MTMKRAALLSIATLAYILAYGTQYSHLFFCVDYEDFTAPGGWTPMKVGELGGRRYTVDNGALTFEYEQRSTRYAMVLGNYAKAYRNDKLHFNAGDNRRIAAITVKSPDLSNYGELTSTTGLITFVPNSKLHRLTIEGGASEVTLTVKKDVWFNYIEVIYEDGDKPGAELLRFDPPGDSPIFPDQTITISSSKTGARIYFTTDGSEPTADSRLYDGPFRVKPGSSHVKAIAIGAGGTESRKETRYYFCEVGGIAEFAANASEKFPTAISSELQVVATGGNVAYLATVQPSPDTRYIAIRRESPLPLWRKNDIVGHVEGYYRERNGVCEIWLSREPLKNGSSTSECLPEEISMASVGRHMANRFVKLRELTINGPTVVDKEGRMIRMENWFDVATGDKGQKDITGFISSAVGGEGLCIVPESIVDSEGNQNPDNPPAQPVGDYRIEYVSAGPGSLEIFTGLNKPTQTPIGDKIDSGSKLDEGEKIYIFARAEEGAQLYTLSVNETLYAGTDLERLAETSYGPMATATVSRDMIIAAAFVNKSGIEAINDMKATEEKPEYYDLSGRFVGTERPAAAGLYIKLSGGRRSKVAVR